MPSEEQGSVTHALKALKNGDADAAQVLWERYFDRMVRLARKKLIASRRRGADEDEEDAALSAFDSFCHGATRGRFPQLTDREDLWRLLVVITARKAGAQAQRRRAQKRGGDWHAIDANGSNGIYADLAAIEQVAGPEPTPEFAALINEQIQLLLNMLENDELRQVALLRMEGWKVDEIVERLGSTRRTIARRLDLIRKTWCNEVNERCD